MANFPTALTIDYDRLVSANDWDGVRALLAPLVTYGLLASLSALRTLLRIATMYYVDALEKAKPERPLSISTTDPMLSKS